MKFVPTLPNKAVYAPATAHDVRQGNNVPMLIQRVVNSVLKWQGRVGHVLDMDQLNVRVHLRVVRIILLIMVRGLYCFIKSVHKMCTKFNSNPPLTLTHHPRFIPAHTIS